MSVNRSLVDTFLYFGYVPDRVEDRSFEEHVIDASRREVFGWETSDWSGMVQEVFAGTLNRSINGLQVVPLSGGLDSRAILAGLLEHFPADSIATATVGVPGAWDYEIAEEVAESAGVQHATLDLRSLCFDVESIQSTVNEGAYWSSVCEAYCMRKLEEYARHVYGRDITLWVGFLGETLAGAHLSRDPPRTWKQAVAQFVRWNSRSGRRFCGQRYDPTEPLSSEPFVSDSAIGFDDQLDLFYRQNAFIRPIVAPKGGAEEYELPFTSDLWIGMWMAAPRKARRNRSAFKTAMLNHYPKLFSLRVKEEFGTPINGFMFRRGLRAIEEGIRKIMNDWFPRIGIYRRSINYLPWGHMMRRRHDLGEAVADAVSSLTERGLDPGGEMRRAHKQLLSGVRNTGAVLKQLLELELSIRHEYESQEV